MGKTDFGEEHAVEIADIVSRYSKYNLMRKAEVQHPMVFSHVNYHESDRMLQLWHDVVNKAEIWNIRYLLKLKTLIIS